MFKIFDQFKRLVQRPEKKPDSRPLPVAPLADAFREYVADGLTPERLADLLKEADAGDVGSQAELFDQIEEKDGHIIGEMGKRRHVILDAEFDLAPADEDSRNVKVYEDLKAYMEGLTQWPDVLVSLQDCVGKGYAGIEQCWDVSEGQAQVDQFKFIEQKRFRWTDPSGLLSTVPLLITDEDPLGEDIPAFKMIMHRYGGMSGHVVRSGIYRICAWWYLFKNYAIKDWVIFCEVYGMPLRLGKYDSGASKEDKEALEIAVRTLGHDAAGVISKATEIEFISGSKGSVSTDLYKDLAGFGNKEMSKAILGGTLTADVDGKGSYAAANTHNDVRHDLINADARALAATIRDQFIRPWVGFNYGWDTPVPKYTGRFRKEDLSVHADMIDKFADRMDIPVSHVRDKFGIPEPESNEECLRPKISPVSAAMENSVLSVAAAANRPRNGNLGFLDRVSGQLEEQSYPYIKAWLDDIKNIMARSATLAELREGITEAFPGMDAREMSTLLGDAMAAGHLGGRYEVKTEEQEDPRG